MAKADLTAARLRELLHYDPQTGVFTWLYERRSVPIGSTAGKLHRISGYLRIDLDGKKLFAHRVAWFYMMGIPPERAIDHVDGNRANNSWSNLRQSDGFLNAQNIRGPLVTNTTGFLGVRLDSRRVDRRYCASITANGRAVHIGYFHTPEEAHDAYLTFKRQLHQGCTI